MGTRLAGVPYGNGLPLTGGTITGNLTVTGRVFLADGTAAAPSLTFTNYTSDGIANVGGGGMNFCDNGAARLTIGSTMSGATGIPLTLASYLQCTELAADPGALANAARIYAIDDATKTEAAVIFGTGVRQQFAQEP